MNLTQVWRVHQVKRKEEWMDVGKTWANISAMLSCIFALDSGPWTKVYTVCVNSVLFPVLDSVLGIRFLLSVSVRWNWIAISWKASAEISHSGFAFLSWQDSYAEKLGLQCNNGGWRALWGNKWSPLNSQNCFGRAERGGEGKGKETVYETISSDRL